MCLFLDLTAVCSSSTNLFLFQPLSAFHSLSSFKPAMVARFLFTAAIVAIHSFTPSLATADPQITPAPLKRSHHDIAKRQSAIETTSPLPLTDYQYPYSALPEQINPFAVGRGPQSGYNRCNSSTEGPTSECQTLVVNSLVRCHFFFSKN
jgi:hypothetical protein